MGISLPLVEETLTRIYNNLYGQEVAYDMDVDELKKRGEEWDSVEKISYMFRYAADELAEFSERDNPDYSLLSELIENVESCPEGDYPKYQQWYDGNGKPVDFM